MTHRQTLIDAVVAALQEILTPSYYTDAGLRVFQFRDPVNEPLSLDELPCLTIRDQQSTITALTAAVHEYSVTLEIAGHDSDQEDAPKKLRQLESDILKAVGVDPTFGGLACYFQPQSSELNTERKGKTVGTVRLSFELRYRTAAWDAETQHVQPV